MSKPGDPDRRGGAVSTDEPLARNRPVHSGSQSDGVAKGIVVAFYTYVTIVYDRPHRLLGRKPPAVFAKEGV
jgi:hypothetical protein